MTSFDKELCERFEFVYMTTRKPVLSLNLGPISFSTIRDTGCGTTTDNIVNLVQKQAKYGKCIYLTSKS